MLFIFLENMRSELLRVQQEEMQRLQREFEVQLAGMKLQLQRANELHSRDVSGYHLMRVIKHLRATFPTIS